MGVLTLPPDPPPAATEQADEVTLVVIFKGLFFYFEWNSSIEAYVPDIGDEHAYRIGSRAEYDLKRGMTYQLAGIDFDRPGKRFSKDHNLHVRRFPPDPTSGHCLHSIVRLPLPDEIHSLARVDRPDSAFAGSMVSDLDGSVISMRQVLVYRKVDRKSLKLSHCPWQPEKEPGTDVVVLIVGAAPHEPMAPKDADTHSLREFNTGIRLLDGLNVRQVRPIPVRIDAIPEPAFSPLEDLKVTNLFHLVYDDLLLQTQRQVASLMGIDLTQFAEAGDVRTCTGCVVQNFDN